jgi:hypothetical protein
VSIHGVCPTWLKLVCTSPAVDLFEGVVEVVREGLGGQVCGPGLDQW